MYTLYKKITKTTTNQKLNLHKFSKGLMNIIEGTHSSNMKKGQQTQHIHKNKVLTMKTETCTSKACVHQEVYRAADKL